jgi:tetratricopeptide (TPR) repeat protein
MAVTAPRAPTASRYIAGTSLRGAPENNMMAFERTRRRIRHRQIWGLAACCWLGSAAAHAQDDVDGVRASVDLCSETAPPRDPEAARVAFRAGQTAFSEGAYARAVALWDQAYRDDCSAHALLLNLAMAQELLGRPDAAIHTLTLFNRRSPESPYVEANERRIVRLEKEVADRGSARPLPQRPPMAPVERPAARDEGPSSLALPLVVSVSGGVVALIGVVLYLEGRASAGSAESRCGSSRQGCPDVDGVVEGERARSRAELGGWLAGAGLGAAAGGLIWHFLSPPERPLDQASVQGWNVVASPDSAGIGWSGRF